MAIYFSCFLERLIPKLKIDILFLVLKTLTEFSFFILKKVLAHFQELL